PEVDCVVLAAGFSRRMGLDKLALDLGGTTVLERTLQNVLRSGVNETIVVINPEATDLEARLSKYNLKLIVNHRSSQGISTSVQAGLSSVAATSQGVIFALGDQPLIPARVYNSLLDSYRSGLQLALYPTYRRRRGNPVLFDRRTWPMLMELEGDKGGSQLFASLPASELCAVEMDIPEVLVDLDTPGDYENISDIFKPEGDS
ncbi:MAG TPA: nucleotidyltransferase family protein, partial [Firmicutes bacterium]|nr:nucleotidyltransferase family protein [Bacillota bacterium]